MDDPRAMQKMVRNAKSDENQQVRATCIVTALNQNDEGASRSKVASWARKKKNIII